LHKLGRYQLRIVVAFLTGHAPMKKHLNIMGLFDGDSTCRFAGWRLNRWTISAAARPWLAGAIISVGNSV
jgi:hypothetical protein